MRVLLLGPYPPPHGGVQNNLLSIHDLLRKKGFSSQIVNITRFRSTEREGVFHPKNWFQLLVLLLRLRYDIIHLHIGGTVTPRLLALSFLCCMMPRSKAVLTFHSGGYPASKEGRSARPRSFRGFVFRRFDRIIGVNREIVELFHRFGVPEEKVRLILPHALSLEPPSHGLPERLDAFYRLHRPVLLTVGGLEPEYDLAIQIEALGVVRVQHPGAGLVIIGSGSLEPDLRRAIGSTPYARDILLCGDVPHEDTLLAMRVCDVFLRTTRFDGDSVAVREAMHFGVPVIATDTGMRPAGVRLVPVGEPRALEHTIALQLEQPTVPRTTAESNEENIEAVLALYDELMGEAGNR